MKRLHHEVPFFDSDKKPKKRPKQSSNKTQKTSTKIQIPVMKPQEPEEQKYQTPDVSKKPVSSSVSKTPISTQEEAR